VLAEFKRISDISDQISAGGEKRRDPWLVAGDSWNKSVKGKKLDHDRPLVPDS
jgi:hypothetical protein